MNYSDVDDYFISEKVPEPQDRKESSAPLSVEHKIYSPDVTLEKGQPSNIDAEKTILGAVILDNDALKKLSITIEPEDFYLDSHRRICVRMLELYKNGKPVDIITLSNILSRHKEIQVIGGIAYLASLTEGLPRRLVIDEYVRIVKDKSILRKIILAATQVITRAADQSESSVQVLSLLSGQVEEIREASRPLLRENTQGPFFIGYKDFTESATEEIDWTVEGIIQREGNGLIIGDSGTSKSLLVFDLALRLVAGASWFHHSIKKRVKVGLVSREDAPGLSQSRLKRLREGAPESLDMFLTGINLDEWLYINTRSQRETWSLQKEMDIQEIIAESKDREIKFLFFDVFRTLWEGNENDNQETAKVLDSAKRIGREAGCQICIVHHLSKSDRGTIFDRARGGGINGWKEWGLGLTVENPDASPRDQIRKIQFHTKAACAAEPIYYRIEGYEKTVHLEQVDPPTQEYTYKEKKSKKKEPPVQSKMYYSDADEEAPPF